MHPSHDDSSYFEPSNEEQMTQSDVEIEADGRSRFDLPSTPKRPQCESLLWVPESPDAMDFQSEDMSDQGPVLGSHRGLDQGSILDRPASSYQGPNLDSLRNRGYGALQGQNLVEYPARGNANSLGDMPPPLFPVRGDDVASEASESDSLPYFGHGNYQNSALPDSFDVPQSGYAASQATDVGDPVFLQSNYDYDAVWRRWPGFRTPLAALSYQQARHNGHSLGVQKSEGDWRAICVPLLLSMPDGVLREVVCGNLATSEKASSWYSEGTSWWDKARTDAPVEYVKILGDEKGRALSPNQIKDVIAILREYIRQPISEQFVGIVHEIDNAVRRSRQKESKPEYIRAGAPRFLAKHQIVGGQEKVLRAAGRDVIVEQFCQGVDGRIAAIPDELHDEPMAKPWQYFGYAFNFQARQLGHDAGSSSWFMSLVLNICRVRLPDEKFQLHSFPICFAVSTDEAKCGELLMTLIGDGLAVKGGGFNVHDAGINNWSADLPDWRNSEALKFWDEQTTFRNQRTPFMKNRDAERKRLAKKDAKMTTAGKEAELEQLRDEVADMEDSNFRLQMGFSRENSEKLDQTEAEWRKIVDMPSDNTALKALADWISLEAEARRDTEFDLDSS